MQDFFVGQVGECYLVEIVAIHKFVEDIGAEHDCLGYRYAHSIVIFEYGVALDERVDKGQAAPFSSQRTLADAGEVGVFVKPVALEYGHHSPVLHFTIGYDGIEYLLAYLGQLFEIVGPASSDKFGQREEGSRVEPP